MNVINRLEKAKSKLSEIAAEKAKAEGMLEQAMEVLKSDGFQTVEAAETEVERLTTLAEETEKAALKILDDINEEYGQYGVEV